jgi:orotate phosphoribosyltransferase
METPMQPADVLRILRQQEALLMDTHVVYTSGKHGSAYVNKDAIYPDTAAVSALCQALAAHFASAAVEVVAAPAIGGVILSQWVAHHLTARGPRVLAVYAEKTESGLVFRRGYDRLLAGKRVLIVEDVLTTGGSVRQVLAAVVAAGGVPVGVAALCNRGGVRAEQLGPCPELYALIELELPAWEASACPLCARGVPINPALGKGVRTP